MPSQGDPDRSTIGPTRRGTGALRGSRPANSRQKAATAFDRLGALAGQGAKPAVRDNPVVRPNQWDDGPWPKAPHVGRAVPIWCMPPGTSVGRCLPAPPF